MADNVVNLRPPLHGDIAKVLSGLAHVSQLYVLKDRVPVAEGNFLSWIDWYRDDQNRIVEYQPISLNDGNEGAVSTVFLGVCCGMNDGKPVLFETLVFVGTREIARQRYTSWEDAELGHKEIVQAMIEGE